MRDALQYDARVEDSGCSRVPDQPMVDNHPRGQDIVPPRAHDKVWQSAATQHTWIAVAGRQVKGRIHEPEPLFPGVCPS